MCVCACDLFLFLFSVGVFVCDLFLFDPKTRVYPTVCRRCCSLSVCVCVCDLLIFLRDPTSIVSQVRAMGNGAMAAAICGCFDPPRKWVGLGTPSLPLLELLVPGDVSCDLGLTRHAPSGIVPGRAPSGIVPEHVATDVYGAASAFHSGGRDVTLDVKLDVTLDAAGDASGDGSGDRHGDVSCVAAGHTVGGRTRDTATHVSGVVSGGVSGGASGGVSRGASGGVSRGVSGGTARNLARVNPSGDRPVDVCGEVYGEGSKVATCQSGDGSRDLPGYRPGEVYREVSTVASSGVEPCRTLLVGDCLSDVALGNRARMATLLVLSGR